MLLSLKLWWSYGHVSLCQWPYEVTIMHSWTSLTKYDRSQLRGGPQAIKRPNCPNWFLNPLYWDSGKDFNRLTLPQFQHYSSSYGRRMVTLPSLFAPCWCLIKGCLSHCLFHTILPFWKSMKWVSLPRIAILCSGFMNKVVLYRIRGSVKFMEDLNDYYSWWLHASPGLKI